MNNLVSQRLKILEGPKFQFVTEDKVYTKEKQWLIRQIKEAWKREASLKSELLAAKKVIHNQMCSQLEDEKKLHVQECEKIGAFLENYNLQMEVYE